MAIDTPEPGTRIVEVVKYVYCNSTISNGISDDDRKELDFLRKENQRLQRELFLLRRNTHRR